MRRLAAVRADPALARDRLVDDPEDRPPVLGQRNQGAEQRHAADKGFGAVDRVEHPDELGIGALAAVFLANDAVIGKARLDQLPHRRLGGAVGGGDRAEVGLVVDGEPGAEIRADRRAGGVGQLGREGEERGRARPQSPISGFADRR